MRLVNLRRAVYKFFGIDAIERTLEIGQHRIDSAGVFLLAARPGMSRQERGACRRSRLKATDSADAFA